MGWPGLKPWYLAACRRIDAQLRTLFVWYVPDRQYTSPSKASLRKTRAHSAEMADDIMNGAEGGLHPDHPLLARAQDALKKQLLANKKRLEDELREKNNAVKVRQEMQERRRPRVLSGPIRHANERRWLCMQMAKVKRESIGVELYGYQQGLAKLQMQLETTHQNYQAISTVRTQVCTLWTRRGREMMS